MVPVFKLTMHPCGISAAMALPKEKTMKIPITNENKFTNLRIN
ncbi:hypothetical protein BTN50_2022 [Candidatus Enterovibrio altilux]|uniref:Uncharacterized protein n=1 Tax=Candidatus Enterovibrio altilux TaxID=1927128 RepID=A0A291BBR5_9GAMM|nr:hypothetical protein BTN50_2022 [Candidatus Enterovibrio luxaltus]